MTRETLEFKAPTRAICDAVLQKISPLIGATYLPYTYDIHDKRHSCCSQQGWVDYYSEQGMHQFDPVRIVANNGVNYIRWDNLSGPKVQNEIMAERNQFCGIHGGFSIVFAENGLTDILSVATDVKRWVRLKVCAESINQ